MIVVPIILRPYGDASRDQELARVEIINDGTGTNERGNCDVLLRRPDVAQPLHAHMEGYDRTRDVADLLTEALAVLGIRGTPKPGEPPIGKPKVCSFCGNEQSADRRVIAGPKQNICADCVSICNDILIEPPSVVELGGLLNSYFGTTPGHCQPGVTS